MDKRPEFKSNCLICGSELKYFDTSILIECVYCGQSFESNASCANGHYICDSCHSFPATRLIREFCVSTKLRDPIEIAMILMRDERIKMHGPEHHFLVSAALLSAFYNVTGDYNNKVKNIEQAEKRAKNVLGGFCGFYGACGAAIGTGIFMSLITDSNPLSKSGWRLSNLITAGALKKIAELGGPRCCKRDTFLAITDAVDFIREHLNVELPLKKDIHCEFSDFNKECLLTACPFYNAINS